MQFKSRLDIDLMCKTALVGVATISLAACGGGGGGGGGGGNSSGQQNSDFGNPAAFQTDEFNSSAALDRIRASEGYASIPGEVGGGGVQVAVIDDGVDSTHPDLDGNVVFDGQIIPGQTPIDDIGGLGVDGHGTAVAGVIAAEKNGQGFHGVAFNAQIASYDYSSFDPNSLTTTASADLLNNAAQFVDDASGVTQGPAGESDIMNFSWGFDGSTTNPDLIAEPSFRAAVINMGNSLADAAARDKISVFAASNVPGTQPGVLEAFVLDERIQGLGIAVVAVDANNNLVSAGCGDLAEFCLAAPGVAVTATVPDGAADNFPAGSCSADGRNCDVNGTSFAAPLVAGSAAVVKAAFPGVSGREVVERILTNAAPLPGQDVGQGLLDLEASLAPNGGLSVALGSSLDGSKAPIDQSLVSFGSSFGINEDAAALLADAIVFDEQNFPYKVDLGQNIDQRSRSTGLDGFIAANRSLSTVETTDYGSISLAFNQDEAAIDPYRAEFEESDVDLKKDDQNPKIRFQTEISDDVDMFMSLNNTSTTELGLGGALAAKDGAFIKQGAFLAPYEQLAGQQSGGGAIYDLSDDTKVAVSAFASADEDTATEINLQKVELVHSTFGDVELRGSFGLIQEQGGILDSSTQGAFGAETSTDTQFFGVSLMAPVTDRFSLFGAYSRGKSSTSSGGASLLNDFSDTRTEAFGAGFVMSDLVDEGDGFSVMVGQPLRVDSGSAEITISTGRTEDGEVLSKTARIDLAPDAREISTEAVYRFAMDDEDQSLAAGAFVRVNPDNDPNASPDVGLGIKYGIRF